MQKCSMQLGDAARAIPRTIGTILCTVGCRLARAMFTPRAQFDLSLEAVDQCHCEAEPINFNS